MDLEQHLDLPFNPHPNAPFLYSENQRGLYDLKPNNNTVSSPYSESCKDAHMQLHTEPDNCQTSEPTCGFTTSRQGANSSFWPQEYNSKPISVRHLDSRGTSSLSSKNSQKQGESTSHRFNFVMTSSKRGEDSEHNEELRVQKAPQPYPASAYPSVIQERHDEHSQNSLQISETSSAQKGTPPKPPSSNQQRPPRKEEREHDTSYNSFNFEPNGAGGTFQSSQNGKKLEYKTIDQRKAAHLIRGDSSSSKEQFRKAYRKKSSSKLSSNIPSYRQQPSGGASMQSSVMGSSQQSNSRRRSRYERKQHMKNFEPVLQERERKQSMKNFAAVVNANKRNLQQQEKQEFENFHQAEKSSIASNMFSKKIENISHITEERSQNKVNSDENSSFQQNSSYLINQINNAGSREYSGNSSLQDTQLVNNLQAYNMTQGDNPNQQHRYTDFAMGNAAANFNLSNSYQGVQMIDDFSTSQPLQGVGINVDKTSNAFENHNLYDGKVQRSGSFQPFQQTFREDNNGGNAGAAAADAAGLAARGIGGPRGQMLNCDILDQYKEPHNLYAINSPGQKQSNGVSEPSIQQQQQQEFFAQMMQQQLPGQFMKHPGFNNTYGANLPVPGNGFNNGYVVQPAFENTQFQNPAPAFDPLRQTNMLGTGQSNQFFQNTFSHISPQEYAGNTMSPSTMQNQLLKQLNHPLMINQTLSSNAYGQTIPNLQNQGQNEMTIGSQELMNKFQSPSNTASVNNFNMFDTSKRTSTKLAQNPDFFRTQQQNTATYGEQLLTNPYQNKQSPMIQNEQVLSSNTISQNITSSQSLPNQHQHHTAKFQCQYGTAEMENGFLTQQEQRDGEMQNQRDLREPRQQQQSANLNQKVAKLKKSSNDYRKDEILNILTNSPYSKGFARTRRQRSHDRKSRSASLPSRILKSAKKDAASRNLKVVKGRLVQRTVSPQTARNMSSPIMQPYIPLTKTWNKQRITSNERMAVDESQFKYKSFKDLRELLAYLNLQSYAHLFSDKGLTHFSDFYLLNDNALRQLLLPKPARKLVLAYQKFYRKCIMKLQRQRMKRAQSADVGRQQRDREYLKNRIRTIQQPPMSFQRNSNNIDFKIPMPLEAEMFQPLPKFSAQSHISQKAQSISQKSISPIYDATLVQKTPQQKKNVTYMKSRSKSRSKSKSGYRSQQSRNSQKYESKPRKLFLQRNTCSLGSNGSQNTIISKKSKVSQKKSGKSAKHILSRSSDRQQTTNPNNYYTQMTSPSIRPQSIRVKTKETKETKRNETRSPKIKRHKKEQNVVQIKKLMKELNRLVLGTEATAVGQSTFQYSMASPSDTDCNSSMKQIDFHNLQQRSENNRYVNQYENLAKGVTRNFNNIENTINRQMISKESSDISQPQQSSQTLQSASKNTKVFGDHLDQNQQIRNILQNAKFQLNGSNGLISSKLQTESDIQDHGKERQQDQEQDENNKRNPLYQIYSEIQQAQFQDVPTTRRNLDVAQEYTLIKAPSDNENYLNCIQTAVQTPNDHINADLMGIGSSRQYQSVNHSDFVSPNASQACGYNGQQFEYTFQDNKRRGQDVACELPRRFEVNSQQQQSIDAPNDKDIPQKQALITFEDNPMTYRDEPLESLHNHNRHQSIGHRSQQYNVQDGQGPMTTRIDQQPTVVTLSSRVRSEIGMYEHNELGKRLTSNQNRRRSIDTGTQTPLANAECTPKELAQLPCLTQEAQEPHWEDPRYNYKLHDNTNGCQAKDITRENTLRNYNDQYHASKENHNHVYGPMKENNSSSRDTYRQYPYQVNNESFKNLYCNNMNTKVYSDRLPSNPNAKVYSDRLPPSYRKQTIDHQYQMLRNDYYEDVQALHKPKFTAKFSAQQLPRNTNQGSNRQSSNYAKSVQNSYWKANEAFQKAKHDIESFHERANQLKLRLNSIAY